MPQKILPPCRNCLREHIKRVNYQLGIWKRAHIAKPVYPEPTHDNGWQCVDGRIEPKWVSGDFIPQQLADVLVEENIAGLTERDESDDEFDDVLYCYGQKINAVTQVSQQKTKVSKNFSKNLLCYKKSILQ